jgi:hypothetical protein
MGANMEKKIYYYRAYDDKEEKNYFKCSFDHAAIEALLKDFEQTHQAYYNYDFVNFLKEKDPEAELIEITNIYY